MLGVSMNSTVYFFGASLIFGNLYFEKSAFEHLPSLSNFISRRACAVQPSSLPPLTCPFLFRIDDFSDVEAGSEMGRWLFCPSTFSILISQAWASERVRYAAASLPILVGIRIAREASVRRSVDKPRRPLFRHYAYNRGPAGRPRLLCSDRASGKQNRRRIRACRTSARRACEAFDLSCAIAFSHARITALPPVS